MNTTERAMHCFETMKLLYEMSEKDQYCDVVLCLDDEININCHKSVIAGQSKVLKDIIDAMPESHEKSVIDIENVSFQAMKLFLKFIYTGEVPKIEGDYHEEFISVIKSFTDIKVEKLNWCHQNLPAEETIVEVVLAEEHVNRYQENIESELICVKREMLNDSDLPYEDEEESAADSSYIGSADDDTGESQNKNKKDRRHLRRSKRKSEPDDRYTPDKKIKKRVTCKGCQQQFDGYNQLTKHKKICEKENNFPKRASWKSGPPYKCPHEGCSIIRDTLGKIRYHFRAAHNRYLKCPFCPLTLHSKGDLRVHVMRHTGEKPYKCPMCNRGFTSLFLVKQHVTTHTKVKRWERERPITDVCLTCGKGFPSENLLYHHIVSVHKNVNERVKLPCDQCNSSFTIPTNLKKHKKKCSGQVVNEVEINEEESDESDDEIGPDDRSYSCEFCSKVYKSQQKISSHLHSQHGVVLEENSNSEDMQETSTEVTEPNIYFQEELPE